MAVLDDNLAVQMAARGSAPKGSGTEGHLWRVDVALLDIAADARPGLLLLREAVDAHLPRYSPAWRRIGDEWVGASLML